MNETGAVEHSPWRQLDVEITLNDIDLDLTPARRKERALLDAKLLTEREECQRA